MKKAKLFLIAVLVLGLAFTACSDDNNLNSPTEQEATTNVSITLSMSSNTRKSLPDDYRLIGEWAGRDDITKVAIYLIDGASVTAQSFNVGTDYKKEVISGQVALVPQESAAIKTTAGVKKVYVLINGTTEVENALAKTPVAEFENAYAQAALYIANSGTSTTVSTSAEKLAVKMEQQTKKF